MKGAKNVRHFKTPCVIDDEALEIFTLTLLKPITCGYFDYALSFPFLDSGLILHGDFTKQIVSRPELWTFPSYVSLSKLNIS